MSYVDRSSTVQRPRLSVCGTAVIAAALSSAIVRGECRFLWSGVGGGVSGRVVSMLTVPAGVGGVTAPDEPALFVGGLFTHAGGVPAANIARWNGTTWLPLANGVGAEALSMTIFDDGGGAGPVLYVGGEFTAVSGLPISYIARWDGAGWSSVGQGTNDHVLAMVVHDDGLGGGPALYAGGFFPNAGNGFAANRIARWDGDQWSPLGVGMNGFVRALTEFDDGSGAGPQLIAAGQFTMAGGVAANYVAQWDGVAWSALGAGLDNVVYALASFDSGSGPELYAAGAFTHSGGAPVGRIARWSGAAWLPVGTGLGNDCLTLAVLDDVVPPTGAALYAGGLFTAAGGTSASRVARWDGHSWRRVGQGVGASFVYALSSFDDGSGPRLHVGGDFIATGAGDAASGIAAATLTGAEGDANGDLVVDFDDISAILAFWGASYPSGSGWGDANADGVVNMSDLTLAIARWLDDCRPSL